SCARLRRGGGPARGVRVHGGRAAHVLEDPRSHHGHALQRHAARPVHGRPAVRRLQRARRPRPLAHALRRELHPQGYPWWASTSAGSGRSSRLDAILLVGRGWAYDDPVVLYKPMASLPYPQIGNGYDDGAAVEIGDTE